MTLDDVAETVRNRLGLAVNEKPRIKTLVNGALQSLAYKLAYSSSRGLLVVEINKTPVLGKIDLSDAAFAGILIDTYQMEGSITKQNDDGTTFFPVQSMSKLRATSPVDPKITWYLMRDRSLVFKNPADGALNTYITPVRLAGSRIPTLADLPGQLDRPLVDEVTLLTEGKGSAINLNIGGPQG